MKIEERLTERIHGQGDIKLEISPMQAFDRLCDYEDIGLSPDEIEQMRQKQLPKEPTDIVEYLRFQTGNCPACRSSVTGINHYCPYCGQAMKWPD